MKYFVSYSWMEKNKSRFGFGNSFIESFSPIQDENLITGFQRALEKQILEEKQIEEEVIIINFIKIG